MADRYHKLRDMAHECYRAANLRFRLLYYIVALYGPLQMMDFAYEPSLSSASTYVRGIAFIRKQKQGIVIAARLLPEPSNQNSLNCIPSKRRPYSL